MRTLELKGEVQEALLRREWSEGLPVVPPTPKRVQAFLDSTSLAADHSLGECPPMYAKCSVEKVAANAVMAGCEPR